MRDFFPVRAWTPRRMCQAALGTRPFVLTPEESDQPISLWEALGRLLLWLALAIGFVVAFNRVMQGRATDFIRFCENGQYILEHGTRHPESTLGRYWPSSDVPWMVFAYVPLGLGITLWYGFNAWTWLGLLSTIHTKLLVDRVTDDNRRCATLAAALLTAPLAVDGLCLGSFHLLMVWLLVAGLLRASRGQAWSGGLLLGTAVWLKLLPALGIGYLIWKRKWQPALAATVCALVIDGALSLAAFGPAGAWREHVAWWHDSAQGTTLRQLTSAECLDEDRLTNQSVAVTVRRLFSSYGTSPQALAAWTTEAGAERAHANRNNSPPSWVRPRRQVQVAELSDNARLAIFLAFNLALASAIGWYCRRSAVNTAPEQWSSEIAMICLATVWFSPVVWSYHPTAVTPALALIACRRTKHSPVTWAASTVWIAGMVLLSWSAARVSGELMWMTLILGGLLWKTPTALFTAGNEPANTSRFALPSFCTAAKSSAA